MRVPTFLLLAAILLFGGALVTPARAGEHEGAEQISKIKVQIERLERKVHALRKAGKGEDAAALHRRAEELRRHLEELLALRARRAGEHEDRDSMEPKRRRAILRGLGQGIEALEALGRKDAAGHLRRIRDELKRGEPHPRAREQAHGEREVVEGWIELMGYAVKVLAKAEKPDWAHIVEHGKHALELTLAGKRDERAMRVRKSAPPRESQAHGLLLAAEILRDHGDKRHAELMADLGRSWQKQAQKRRGRVERDDEEREHVDLDSLEQRVRILVAALPALREGERRKAAAVLERAIRTGRVLLADREDDEAREILEETPPLGEITEVLRLAAELWEKYGREDKARMAAGLAEHYTRRMRAAEREEREEHGDQDEEGHDDDADEGDDDEEHREWSDELEDLQDEMEELRATIQRMQRQLRKLLEDK